MKEKSLGEQVAKLDETKRIIEGKLAQIHSSLRRLVGFRVGAPGTAESPIGGETKEATTAAGTISTNNLGFYCKRGRNNNLEPMSPGLHGFLGSEMVEMEQNESLNTRVRQLRQELENMEKFARFEYFKTQSARQSAAEEVESILRRAKEFGKLISKSRLGEERYQIPNPYHYNPRASRDF